MKTQIALLLGASLLLAACGTVSGPTAPRPAARVGAFNAAPADPAASESPVAEPSEAPAPAVKPRAYTIEQLGVGKRVVAALAKQGVSNSLQLLEVAGSPAGREKLLEATGLTNEKLYDLLHMADLIRVKGIGPTQSRLLIAAGVTTIKDLARRNPLFLQTALDAINGEERFSERTPSAEVVAAWIEDAKQLERVVRY